MGPVRPAGDREAYAEDRLAAAGETIAARDRHLRHFHALATAQGHTGISELRLGVKVAAGTQQPHRSVSNGR